MGDGQPDQIPEIHQHPIAHVLRHDCLGVKVNLLAAPPQVTDQV